MATRRLSLCCLALVSPLLSQHLRISMGQTDLRASPEHRGYCDNPRAAGAKGVSQRDRDAPGAPHEQRGPGTVRGSSAPSYSAELKSLRKARGEQLPPNKLIMNRKRARLIKKGSYHEEKSVWNHGVAAAPGKLPVPQREAGDGLCLRERSRQFKGGLRENKMKWGNKYRGEGKRSMKHNGKT